MFLICAFPIHLWTLILVMRDASWISERTTAWDAVGVGAYGLVLAFLESLVVFLLLLLLGGLIGSTWREKRVALLGGLVLVASAWAIFAQLYFLNGMAAPPALVHTLAGTTRPLRWLYALMSVAIAPTLLLPTGLILWSKGFNRFFNGLLERISLLSALYLALDGVGLVIVLLRNLT